MWSTRGMLMLIRRWRILMTSLGMEIAGKQDKRVKGKERNEMKNVVISSER